MAETLVLCYTRTVRGSLKAKTLKLKVRELTHPEVVHDVDGTLEALADLHIDVLIEAGAHRAE